MISRTRVILVTLLLLVVAAIPISCPAREFRLGIISKKPAQKKLSGYDPLARYVGERLKAVGVTGGKVVLADNLEAMLVKIRAGEVDVVLESPFSAVRMIDAAGMQPRLLVWKEGAREYRTVFFARKDSRIRALADLKGKVLVLQDPGSTSGFLIPIAELTGRGLKVVPAKAGAAADAVRYRLVEHEKNQVFWVIQKKAAAAAFGSDDWEDLRTNQKRELRIFHSTRPVLRYLGMFHPDLPPQLADAIAAVMTQMHRDPEGMKALKGASDTRKIEPLAADDLDSLEYVRQLMRGL